MLFLFSVLCFFRITPTKHKWIVLLISSYVFYATIDIRLLIPLLLSTGITYKLCLDIEKQKCPLKKKFLFYFVLLSNLGILVLFGSQNNFCNFNIIFDKFSIFSSDFIFLKKYFIPIGVSFYILQSLSYCVDVYRGDIESEKSVGKLALYLAYFPKLLAGPIERANSFIPQLKFPNQVTISTILIGLKRILLGFFKKIIIADNLAILIDPIFTSAHDQNGIILLIGTYLFAFQIYFDFSGYCDIAIGISQLFGLKLSENFKKPYFAESISEFWKRWHITLTSWLKDYIYIPLGGKKASLLYWSLNILIVFLISGVWHGAHWNYIVWALINCLYYVIGITTKDLRNFTLNITGLYKFKKLLRLVKIVAIFNLISFSWIFFRAETVEQGLYISRKIFIDVFESNYDFSIVNSISTLSINASVAIISLIILLGIEKTFILEKFYYHEDPNDVTVVELCLINTLIIILLFFAGSQNQFFYFQF